MFGLNNKKNKNNNKKKSEKTDKLAGQRTKSSVGTDKAQRQSDDIRREALSRVTAAKNNLGDETIQKITQSMQKMERQNTLMTSAKKKLAEEADAALVAHEILSMIDEK